MLTTAIITAIAAIVGAALTIINMWTQAVQQVGNLYDQMVKYRVDHPEVLCLSREWQQGYFERVYGKELQEAKKWIIYYSYVELCIGYCNAVLSSWWRLPPGSYKDHHRPLVLLTLTEHNPIFEELVQDAYLSELIKDFRSKLGSKGWNWEDEHRKLAS